MQDKSSPNREQLARQCFKELTNVAQCGKTVTYEELGKITDAGAGFFRTLPPALELLWHWCEQEGLPHINALVVNKNSGVPGDGYQPSRPTSEKGWQKVWREVHCFDWSTVAYGTADMSVASVYPKFPVEVVGFTYCNSLHLTRRIEAVKTRRGADAKYIVSKPFTVKVDLQLENEVRSHDIHVPTGYKSDLASVPRGLRWVVGRAGPHLEACVVHDWLYEAWVASNQMPQKEMKQFADDVLEAGMREAKVNKAIIRIISVAVRTFGGKDFRNGRTALQFSMSDIFARSDEFESCCAGQVKKTIAG